MKFELCIENFYGAKIAEKLRFNSIEINSSLALGGLTPNFSLVKKIAEEINIDKICMIRPRPAGFLYSEYEYLQMCDDLDIFLNENIDGIAFGFLTENFEIDIERTKNFVSKIHKKGKIAVFHRAIDNVLNYEKSIETLINLGVDRILTSGQSNFAIDGKDVIKNIVKKYSDRIQILVGSGINSSNIKNFVEYTNVDYVHSTCKKFCVDITTEKNVSYSIFGYPQNSYLSVDKDEAFNLIKNAPF